MNPPLKPVPAALAAAAALLANGPAAPVIVLDEMKGQIAPQAQVIWDVMNAAQDDAGNPVAAKVKPADWARMQAAADAMTASLARLEHGNPITVRAPGQKTMDEQTPDGTPAARVQGYIDANPEGFRAMAAAFAEISRSLATAAQTRDVRAINTVANDLDQACEGCHKAYWYPEAQN
jgi:cytochrome c556